MKMTWCEFQRNEMRQSIVQNLLKRKSSRFRASASLFASLLLTLALTSACSTQQLTPPPGTCKIPSPPAQAMVPCGDPVSLAPWMETYDVVDAETADIWNKGQLHAVNANGILLKCWRGRWTGLSEWINTVYEKCNETESAQAN